MECLNRSLSDLLYCTDGLELSQENITFITYQIFCGVNHLHKSELIHRVCSCLSNVLNLRFRTWKLVSFVFEIEMFGCRCFGRFFSIKNKNYEKFRSPWIWRMLVPKTQIPEIWDPITLVPKTWILETLIPKNCIPRSRALKNLNPKNLSPRTSNHKNLNPENLNPKKSNSSKKFT
jgi:hypothetical protein